jgi:hypothetical protein
MYFCENLLAAEESVFDTRERKGETLLPLTPLLRLELQYHHDEAYTSHLFLKPAS